MLEVMEKMKNYLMIIDNKLLSLENGFMIKNDSFDIHFYIDELVGEKETGVFMTIPTSLYRYSDIANVHYYIESEEMFMEIIDLILTNDNLFYYKVKTWESQRYED